MNNLINRINAFILKCSPVMKEDLSQAKQTSDLKDMREASRIYKPPLLPINPSKKKKGV
jgi:hypothetical protein